MLLPQLVVPTRAGRQPLCAARHAGRPALHVRILSSFPSTFLLLSIVKNMQEASDYMRRCAPPTPA